MDTDVKAESTRSQSFDRPNSTRLGYKHGIQRATGGHSFNTIMRLRRSQFQHYNRSGVVSAVGFNIRLLFVGFCAVFFGSGLLFVGNPVVELVLVDDLNGEVHL